MTMDADRVYGALLVWLHTLNDECKDGELAVERLMVTPLALLGGIGRRGCPEHPASAERFRPIVDAVRQMVSLPIETADPGMFYEVYRLQLPSKWWERDAPMRLVIGWVRKIIAHQNKQRLQANQERLRREREAKREIEHKQFLDQRARRAEHRRANTMRNVGKVAFAAPACPASRQA